MEGVRWRECLAEEIEKKKKTLTKYTNIVQKSQKTLQKITSIKISNKDNENMRKNFSKVKNEKNTKKKKRNQKKNQ